MASKQDKQKAKQEKLLKKEAKAKAKFLQKQAKRSDKQKQSGKITVEKNTADWTDDTEQKAVPVSTEKKGFWEKHSENREFKKTLYDKKDLKRAKEEKEKTDYKLAFKEFPVKMVKEVNKIKWSGKKNLTVKYLQVIIFMVCFAIVFYLVDWAFQAIFTAIHVI